LGDLVDRGPRSKEVLDTIIKLQAAGYFIRSIRGNHEEMLLNACRDRNSFQLWIETGGFATLKSFGVEDACEIPSIYLKFLYSFPYYILLDKFLLCHAGINCNATDPFSDTEALLWSRGLPVIPEKIGNRRIICGHTVQTLADISNSLNSNRILLDGGCVFRDRDGLGNLIALELDTMTLHHTEYIDL
jgi:serine/threonine protein phosphatase 1